MADAPANDAARTSEVARRPIPTWPLYTLIGALVGAICYNGDIDGPLDLYHEGDRLATYDAVCEGALPFRDFYVSHGLGEDVIKPYLACKLFGVSVESVRRIGRNSYIYSGYLPVLGPLAVLLAGIAWLRDVRAVGLLAILLTCGLYEISERPAAAMLAVAAAGMWHHSRRYHWLVICGFLVGLAALYSTETGVFAAAAIGIWLLVLPRTSPVHSRASTIGIFAVGILAILLPFVAWCTANGILADLIENLKIQFGLRGEVWPNRYPVPSWTADQPLGPNLFVLSAVIGLFYLLPLSYIAGIALAVSKRTQARLDASSLLLLAAIVGLVFWLSPFTQSDLWHVAYVSGTFFFFAVALFQFILQSRRSLLANSALGVAAAALLSLFFVSEGGVLARRVTGRENRLIPPHLHAAGRELVQTDLNRLGRIHIPIEQAAEVSAVVRVIQEKSSPEDYLLDLSDQPLYYFLAQRRCPTRFHLLSQCNSPNLRRVMLDEVQAKPSLPKLILYPGLAELPQDDIGSFITRNYRPFAVIGGLRIFALNREWREVEGLVP